MRTLKTGDPCPCCGKPIRMTDPDALQLLNLLADIMGLPENPAEEKEDGNAENYYG